MSAGEVTEQLVGAIESDEYDLIVCNFANPDMVGHTGDLAAAMKAVEAADKPASARRSRRWRRPAAPCWSSPITAIARPWSTPRPAGRTPRIPPIPVPVILAGGPSGASLRNGRLADIAPTALALMGLAPPPEMTGKRLIET
jgi:2,3-bisphosphoglycerate-independent phosphoglycerate mutase